MSQRVLRLIKFIEITKDFNSFIKVINLDLNSSFLCLLSVLEDAILKYDSINDYSYLVKLNDYLKNSYERLSEKNRLNNRKYLIKLKNCLRKNLGTISEYDKEYYKKIYYSLEMMIIFKKDNDYLKELNDLNLSELLYEVIFHFNSLEYVDLLIEKDKNIVNSKKDNKSIFLIVFHEYLNGIVNKNDKVTFYIRVLYKFLHEEAFHFTSEMKEDIINSLDTFINFKNISGERLEEIKDLYAYVKNQYVMNNNKVYKEEYEMKYKDVEYLEKFNEKAKGRTKIDEYIITIDDDDSMVLDDGISITKLPNGNISFKVHIADPLSVFPYKSDLIQDAKQRTSTIYLKDDVIHMLPKVISEDKFSLISGKDRYAKTFCFEYNPNIGLVDFKIINSIINVSKRYSYDDINLLYKNGGNNHDEEIMLGYYNDIVNYLKKVFKNAKIYEEFKRGNIIGNNQKMNSFSENLICYSMLATGYYTAKYFYENNFPYAYRCHQYNEEWQNIINEYMISSNQTIDKKILKDMKNRFPKSYYSRENKGHMGLKIDYYSHVTSPLRRFSDDLNMHAINICYFHNPSDKEIYRLNDEIDTTCNYINMQSNTIDEYINKKLIK